MFDLYITVLALYAHLNVLAFRLGFDVNVNVLMLMLVFVVNNCLNINLCEYSNILKILASKLCC